MTFDFTFAWHVLPVILQGAEITVWLTVAIFLVALGLGLVLAVLRRSLPRLPARILEEVSNFIRMTPPLVQLYVAFFVLPVYGIVLSPVATGILVLGIQSATFTAEVYRAGIEAVPRGQWEAAVALGLPRRRAWIRIILPQAIRKVVPPLGNYLIGTFKTVPLLATITVQEMLGVALTQGSFSFRYFEPITLVGLIYLTMSYVSSVAVRRLEVRFAHA